MPGTPKYTASNVADAAAFAAPAVFVFLWASGFIGAKLGLPYAEPLTFLTVRMSAVVLVLGAIILATRPAWPSRTAVAHSAVTGLLVHGCYLGGVFVAMDHKLPAGFAALVVSLQPILTSTLANRLFGEKVAPRQWLGLALGVAGVYLVVQGRTEGDAPLIAWASATFALDRHDDRHALSEALRRRDRMAHRLPGAICERRGAVRGGRVRDRDHGGAMERRVSDRGRLAGVRAFARRDLAAVFPDPPSGGGARDEPVLSDVADDRADGLADVQRAACADRRSSAWRYVSQAWRW